MDEVFGPLVFVLLMSLSPEVYISGLKWNINKAVRQRNTGDQDERPVKYQDLL